MTKSLDGCVHVIELALLRGWTDAPSAMILLGALEEVSVTEKIDLPKDYWEIRRLVHEATLAQPTA